MYWAGEEGGGGRGKGVLHVDENKLNFSLVSYRFHKSACTCT